MKRTLIRVIGTLLILAAVPFAMAASLWVLVLVWAVATYDEPFAVTYQYGHWIDASGWVAWGLIIAGAVWAIRVLFRCTQSPSDGD